VSDARPAHDRVGLACAATTALTWGMVGTLVRAIPALGPGELVAGRLAFALAGAVPVLALPVPRAAVRAAAGDGRAWALAALMAAYYALAVAAFRLAPVADVALLLATAPLCALGLRRLRGARATPRERGGALVALVGVAVTLVPSVQAATAAGTGARLGGDALGLAAAAASAGYALAYRAAQLGAAHGRVAPHPFGVAVLTFAVGVAALGARALARGVPLVAVGRLDARGWALLAVLGVVSTLVPTLAFATAARRLPPVLTSAAQLLVPVVSAATAALALGERPSAWLVPGGALIGAGLARLLLPPATSRA
jgi:drug/metabolite transporter (DMT)-like permease